MKDIKDFLEENKKDGAEIRIPRDLVGSRWVIVEAHLKDNLTQAIFLDGKLVYSSKVPLERTSVKTDFMNSEAFLDLYKNIT